MKKVLISAGVIVLLVFFGLDESNGQWASNGDHIYNTNNGYVGIGTNSPGTLLYVSKNMGEPTITVRNDGGGGGATYSMIDVLSGANWKFKATTFGGFKIRDHANNMDIMTFEANSAPNSIYIKSGGNIGMGTTAPNAKLHINHNAMGLIVGGNGTISGTTFEGLGFQYYWPSGEGAIQSSYPGGYGFLTFHTTYGGAMAERMRITTLGNVGIGTNNPTSILHVVRPAGTTATAAQIINSEDADNANGLYINTTRATSGANILNLASGGTSRMYVKSDGHVGINTTNPASLLHVYFSGNAYSYLGYINVTPNYFYHYQLLADGAGQSAVYGYRASSNDGTGYTQYTSNSAVKGYSYWGDEYTFGTTGFSYLDYTRCGGVLGGSSNYSSWGSLCYKTSSSTVYGGYFTSTITGSGKSSSTAMTGIGLGAWGDLIGADIHGKVYGSYIEGENYAIFADGDVYKNKLDIHLQENGTETMTILYTNVTTDATVQTYGTASLSSGKATIIFDPAFIASVSSENPVVVTVTPLGRSNGVYLSEISKSGFTIVENNDGKSNVDVNFIAIGKRAGFENPDLAPEVISADYTGKLARGLNNDADTQTNGQGLYYENGKLVVGIHPSTLPDPNKPANDRHIPVLSSAPDVQQEKSAPAEIQVNVK